MVASSGAASAAIAAVVAPAEARAVAAAAAAAIALAAALMAAVGLAPAALAVAAVAGAHKHHRMDAAAAGPAKQVAPAARCPAVPALVVAAGSAGCAAAGTAAGTAKQAVASDHAAATVGDCAGRLKDCAAAIGPVLHPPALPAGCAGRLVGLQRFQAAVVPPADAGRLLGTSRRPAAVGATAVTVAWSRNPISQFPPLPLVPNVQDCRAKHGLAWTQVVGSVLWQTCIMDPQKRSQFVKGSLVSTVWQYSTELYLPINV